MLSFATRQAYQSAAVSPINQRCCDSHQVSFPLCNNIHIVDFDRTAYNASMIYQMTERVSGWSRFFQPHDGLPIIRNLTIALQLHCNMPTASP
jgi:hypothetical protein